MTTFTLVAAPPLTVTGGTITFSTAPVPPPPTPDSVPPQVVPESIPLVRDFVFASLTSDIIDTDTVLAVDDVSSFPTDAELAKAPLYLTIEAELLHPATFEIVKLTSVDIAGLTLTVVRGQFGTTAQSHSAPTLLKGALTADLVRLFRAELAPLDRVPPPDTDVFAPGDRVYLRSRGAFTFAGGARFQQTDFNGDDSLGAAGSTTLGPSTEVDAVGPMGVTHWAIVQGDFGTPVFTDTTRLTQSAIVTATDGTTNQAQALRPFGGNGHQVDFNITLGGVDGVDAGIVLGATADGKYGWYLSLTTGALPTLYRIESGALTSLGTFGDTLGTNAAIFGSVVLYDDVLRVWLELSGSPSELTTSSFSIAPGLLRGNNAGLMANSASCATDASLCWTSIGSSMPVGTGVMRGANRTITFAKLVSGTATEQPTTVDPTTFNWGVEPWTPVGSSVWGMFLPSFPVLRFVSGDTGGRASITSDLRARDLDVQIVWAEASDPSAVYGILLRSTADGQNAIYLEVLQSGAIANVCALVGGVRTLSTFGSLSLPPSDSGLRHVRIILSGNSLYFYDTTGSPLLLGSAHIPAMYQDFGGTCLGWMMDSALACSDPWLGVVQVWPSPVDVGVDSGWVQEPTMRATASPPTGAAPLGSLWLDTNATEFHISVGPGQWRSLIPRIVYSEPTDVAPDFQLAIDVSGYQLYVSVGGTWHSLTGTGGGGGGTQRGLPDMGFFGSITAPILRGDFVHQAGGLMRAGWDDGGGQWQPSSTTISEWPSDGSTIYYWLAVQDASIDSSTGVASLTANADSSAGLVVATQRVVIDGLHISFDADIPDADSGFTIGWFNSPTIIADNSTPPIYKQWNGTLPLNPAWFGVGVESGTFFTFTPTVGVDHQGGSGFFGGSPQPGTDFTVGSHHWDIRFFMDSPMIPSSYQAAVYMDGVRLFTTYLYLTNAPYEGGYFFLSAATGGSGTTGAVEVSNFKVLQAQAWTRVRTDALKEFRVPLVLLNSWMSTGTHVASWSIDQDRIRLHGSISGGAAATQVCEIDPDLHPDTGEVFLPVSAQDSTSAWVMRTLHVNYNTIEFVDAQTGDTIYLDNASFPRWL